MSLIKSIDIIVPCYNPLDNWELDLIDNYQNIIKVLPSLNFNLFLVNDASTIDLSKKIQYIRQTLGNQFHFLEYKENKGKGYAIRHGVSSSSADAIIYTDIDFPYIKENLISVANDLTNGNDIVIGVRSKKYYESVPKRRVLISKIARLLLKHILHLKVTDTQCGLKGFSKEAKETFIQTKINRFLFDMEFIFKASKNKNLKITPREVTLREGVQFSKMNFAVIINEAWNFLNIYLFG